MELDEEREGGGGLSNFSISESNPRPFPDKGECQDCGLKPEKTASQLYCLMLYL